MKYRRRGGGYYLDVGCSGLIISGKIRLLQFDQIERFVAEGARLKDGSIRAADLLLLATGYYTQQDLVRSLLGEQSRSASDRSGASARMAKWRTCGSVRRKRACGSLPVASGNAVSIQNTSPCKSRRWKKACYRGDRLPETSHGRLIDQGSPRLNRVLYRKTSVDRHDRVGSQVQYDFARQAA